MFLIIPQSDVRFGFFALDKSGEWKEICPDLKLSY